LKIPKTPCRRDHDLKLQAAVFQKGILKHEGEYFMDVQGMHACQQASFTASAVM
jgi:hypothetical protein